MYQKRGSRHRGAVKQTFNLGIGKGSIVRKVQYSTPTPFFTCLTPLGISFHTIFGDLVTAVLINAPRSLKREPVGPTSHT
jgi:hypothetical protein